MVEGSTYLTGGWTAPKGPQTLLLLINILLWFL